MMTTPEQYVDMERNLAVRAALDLIGTGYQPLAAVILTDSVHKQARWLAADKFTLQPEYVWPHR